MGDDRSPEGLRHSVRVTDPFEGAWRQCRLPIRRQSCRGDLRRSLRSQFDVVVARSAVASAPHHLVRYADQADHGAVLGVIAAVVDAGALVPSNRRLALLVAPACSAWWL